MMVYYEAESILNAQGVIPVMNKRYLVALDQGTTSSRAVVFTLEGHLIASANREFPQHYPRPGGD